MLWCVECYRPTKFGAVIVPRAEFYPPVFADADEAFGELQSLQANPDWSGFEFRLEPMPELLPRWRRAE